MADKEDKVYHALGEPSSTTPLIHFRQTQDDTISDSTNIWGSALRPGADNHKIGHMGFHGGPLFAEDDNMAELPAKVHYSKDEAHELAGMQLLAHQYNEGLAQFFSALACLVFPFASLVVQLLRFCRLLLDYFVMSPISYMVKFLLMPCLNAGWSILEPVYACWYVMIVSVTRLYMIAIQPALECLRSFRLVEISHHHHYGRALGNIDEEAGGIQVV